MSFFFLNRTINSSKSVAGHGCTSVFASLTKPDFTCLMGGNKVRSMATKKAGGSTTNGRDSAGRRLGIKVWPNKQMLVQPGNIIVRQRGQKFRAGTNVGMGKDHTLFAKAAGIVHMTRLETNKKRNVVHVLPPQQQSVWWLWRTTILIFFGWWENKNNLICKRNSSLCFSCTEKLEPLHRWVKLSLS